MTKPKLYRVEFKDIASNSHYCLNYDKYLKYWSIDTSLENETFKTSFTEEELRGAGFSWVFDSELTEVCEVQ